LLKELNFADSNAEFCKMLTESTIPREIVDESRAASAVVPNNYDSNIDEWNHKWEGPVVTWKLDTPNDDMQPYNVQRILTLAFMAWGLHTKDIRFRLQRRPTADVDIPIAFLGKNEDKLFRDSPSVLAYAYFPTKSQIGGDMVFNDEYIWSKDGLPISAHLGDPVNYPDENTPVKLRTYNLQHTGVHEIGHAIGLKHAVNLPQAVMHPYYNNEVWPQPNDLERITGIYGKREFRNPRRYDVLSKRVQQGWKPKTVVEMKTVMAKRKAQKKLLVERRAKRDARPKR